MKRFGSCSLFHFPLLSFVCAQLFHKFYIFGNLLNNIKKRFKEIKHITCIVLHNSHKTLLRTTPSNTLHASFILLTFPYIPTNSFTTMISYFNIRQFLHFHKEMHSSPRFFHKRFKEIKTNRSERNPKTSNLEEGWFTEIIVIQPKITHG